MFACDFLGGEGGQAQGTARGVPEIMISRDFMAIEWD